MRRVLISLALATGCILLVIPLTAEGVSPDSGQGTVDTAVGPRSGLPLPRFASLKTDEANLRRGPGKEHPVVWVYVRRNMPLEILEEYDTWRRVRDIDGAEGWISVSMLSEKRTAMIRAGAEMNGTRPWNLRRKPSPEAAILARLEPGVVALIRRCPGAWCEIKAGKVAGWIERSALWGLYPGEAIN